MSNYDDRMNDRADKHAKMMNEQRKPSKPLSIKERRLIAHNETLRIKENKNG